MLFAGPYSQCVQYDDTLYVAGQIALVPHTMQMLEGGSVEQEARLSLQHVDSVLQAMKSNLNKMKSCVCYVTDIRYVSAAKNVLAESVEDLDEKNVVFIEVEALPRMAKVEWQVVTNTAAENNMKVLFKQFASDYEENEDKVVFKEALCKLFKTMKVDVGHDFKSQIKLFYVARNAKASYVDCLVQKYVDEIFTETSIKPEVMAIPVKSLYYMKKPRHIMLSCHSVCNIDNTNDDL